nr:hypothetical protein [Candidatus Sigynarchaeota archaeon]
MVKLNLHPFVDFQDKTNTNSIVHLFRTIGIIAWIAGQVAILVQIWLSDLGTNQLANMFTASFWTSRNDTIYVAIILIGIPIFSALSLVPAKGFQSFLLFMYSLLFCVVLWLGGGWYVGTIIGLAGIFLIGSVKSIPATRQRVLNRKQERNIIAIALVGVAATCVAAPAAIIIPELPPYYLNPTLYEGQAGAPNVNNTLYILTIWENWGTYESEVDYFLQELGNGSQYVRIGFSASCWYMAELNGAVQNWSFNPVASLYAKLNFSVNHNLPVLFHMNGGNWGMEGWKNTGLSSLVADLWKDNNSNVQWDQKNNSISADLAEHMDPLKPRLFTLSKYSPIYAYREQNIKIAGAIIKQFSEDHPDLFVGCSMDSEIHLEQNDYYNFDNSSGVPYKSYYDYNPLVIREFREGLEAKYTTIANVNGKFGVLFASFAAVDPPRVYDPGNPWWEEWTAFRADFVKANVDAEARWLTEVGIPESKIYSHQILTSPDDEDARYRRCDTLYTADIEHGNVGVTRYGLISPSIFRSIREISGFNWGVFEWNIWSGTDNTYANYMYMFKCMYQNGIRVLCPYSWYEGQWPILQIRNNTQFKRAIKDFSQAVGDVPRATSPNGFLPPLDTLIGFMQIAIDHFNGDNFYKLVIALGAFHLFYWPMQPVLKRMKGKRQQEVQP